MFQRSTAPYEMLLALTATFGFIGGGLGCDHQPSSSHAQTEKANQKSQAPSVEHDVSELRDRAADQAHAMMDVGYHFSNLWFAAKNENWPLADFFWSETRSHLHWAVRIIPVRKDNAGQEIKLVDILDAFENSPFKQLREAIDAKDQTQFEVAYRFTLESCYACHKASDKPYLRPQIPYQPATTIINFDPKATWPK